MKTEAHWRLIFHYTCTLSSPFFPFTSTFSLLSVLFCFIFCRHRSNLMGLPLFLRRIPCCYSLFTLYNHWVSHVSLSLFFLLLLGLNGYCQLHFSVSWSVSVFCFCFFLWETQNFGFWVCGFMYILRMYAHIWFIVCTFLLG